MVSDRREVDVKKTILAALLALPLVAAAQFPCYPSQIGGKGSRAFFEEDAAAKAYGWWCPDPWVEPQLVIVGGPNSAFDPNWKQIALDLLTKSEKERTTAFYQYYKVTYPIDADGYVLVPSDVFPVYKKVWDQLQPLKPPTFKWVVASNGTLFTRPTYRYTNGARGASVGTVSVGAPCDCNVRFIERSQPYCSVNNDLTQVAACRKGG